MLSPSLLTVIPHWIQFHCRTQRSGPGNNPSSTRRRSMKISYTRIKRRSCRSAIRILYTRIKRPPLSTSLRSSIIRTGPSFSTSFWYILISMLLTPASFFSLWAISPITWLAYFLYRADRRRQDDDHREDCVHAQDEREKKGCPYDGNLRINICNSQQVAVFRRRTQHKIDLALVLRYRIQQLRQIGFRSRKH